MYHAALCFLIAFVFCALNNPSSHVTLSKTSTDRSCSQNMCNAPEDSKQEEKLNHAEQMLKESQKKYRKNKLNSKNHDEINMFNEIDSFCNPIDVQDDGCNSNLQVKGMNEKISIRNNKMYYSLTTKDKAMINACLYAIKSTQNDKNHVQNNDNWNDVKIYEKTHQNECANDNSIVATTKNGFLIKMRVYISKKMFDSILKAANVKNFLNSAHDCENCGDFRITNLNQIDFADFLCTTPETSTVFDAVITFLNNRDEATLSKIQNTKKPTPQDIPSDAYVLMFQLNYIKMLDTCITCDDDDQCTFAPVSTNNKICYFINPIYISDFLDEGGQYFKTIINKTRMFFPSIADTKEFVAKVQQFFSRLTSFYFTQFYINMRETEAEYDKTHKNE